MYAPITKPAAAERIPKNAPAADEDLKNKTTVIKSALDDIHPKRITPYAPRMLSALKCIFPKKLKIISPMVKRSDVIRKEEITAAERYERIICHLFTGVARMS